eukprot:Nitzschia sp. Nitz4//scaffold157_size52427//330//3656//NITZ4_006835-RA/size52427-augustus-gene-0.58-mRNA-1//-1//CDS//3329537440//2179//frame0
MGLVATWLNGIGLSSAVPTFAAAGIVTPAALAELDVAHFEALGIADPDDRRKLFYLVQRIKMAVNKDKTAKADQHSVEQQVEAVVTLADVQPTPATTGLAPPSKQVSTTNNKNSDAPTEQQPRRSRRLAAKQTSPDFVNGVNGTSADSNKNSSNGSAKENQLQRPISGTTAASTNHSSAQISAPRKNNARSSKHQLQPASHVDDPAQLDPAALEIPTLPTSKVKLPTNSRRSISSTRPQTVFNLEDSSNNDEDFEMPTQSKSTTKTSSSARRHRSGLQKPMQVTALAEDKPDQRQDNSKDLLSSKSYATPTGKRHESKLQNPGISMRTGKQLSVVPSESAAPMSPLIDFNTAVTNGTATTSRITDNRSSLRTDGVDRGRQGPSSRRRRRSVSSSSRNSENLDALLESSFSDMDEEESDSSLSRPSGRPARSRSKSMGTSRKSISKRTTRTSIAPNVEAPTSRAGPVVLDTPQPESWAAKVQYLREDNTAEHDLFRDQEDLQLYEYDMRIRVIVRKRPVSKAEQSLSGGVDVIHPLDYGEYGRVLVYQPKTRVDLTKEVETIPFSFDNVYDEASTNTQIYQRSLRSLIQPFFQGQWSTVFAYGQTGSGKTYTMMGSTMTGVNAGTSKSDRENLGLYYLAALDIFDMVQRPEYQHLSVQVSLFEIYGGKLFDLLNSRKQVKCLEDSRGKVCFPGLTEHPVGNPDDLMELIEQGGANRSTGTTSRNADSSRSHAVLQLKLRKDVGRRKNVEHGRLNFIDLAGSERGADTSSASRATRLEGAEINTSLLALKEVIRALATGSGMAHIPFRGSKLTQVLKDSFVGENSRCCMIACVSPDIANCEQTLNTLRYADRVKERNPETGALSKGYDEPTRLNLLTDAQNTSNSDGDEEGSVEEYDDCDDEDFQPSDVTDTDAVQLDELLRSELEEPPPTTSNWEMFEADSSMACGVKKSAGEHLVATHRTVMSTMLSMVKDEMALVNEVDADRDGLDEYLLKLETMQNTQLDLIAKLRGSLGHYVAACEAPIEQNHVSDDESFEDLRD